MVPSGQQEQVMVSLKQGGNIRCLSGEDGPSQCQHRIDLWGGMTQLVEYMASLAKTGGAGEGGPDME